MAFRKYAIQRKQRTSFGGSFEDSFTWASKFRNYKPTDFGIMSAQMYSSEPGNHLVNKPFLWHTLAQGNVYEVEPGHTEFTWALGEDVDARLRITRVHSGLGSTPGFAQGRFKVYVDKDFAHEPVVLKTAGTNQPMMKIIGYPVPVGAGDEFELTFEIQDGNPASYVDPDYLQEGMFLYDATTQVSDELNMKYGGLQFGSTSNLQGTIGFVARKMEMTDKFIKLEMAARAKGQRPSQGYSFGGKTHTEGIGVGYIYGTTKEGTKEIKAGGYVTAAESMLEDRIALDKEFSMTFGRLQLTQDYDSSRPIKSPAGWLQLVRDGYHEGHSGNLTLSNFYDFLNAKYTTRKDFMNRATVMRAGSGGLEFFSRLITAYAGASPFTLVDSHFIDRVSAEHTDKALRWGAQFTQIRMPNGHLLEVTYDPTKDNKQWYPEMAQGTNYTKESFSFDIYDLGETDSAPANARSNSNLAMITDPESEEYFHISNVYDAMTGSKKKGENVSSLSKEVGMYRASSYALAVWDTSRIARWEYIGA